MSIYIQQDNGVLVPVHVEQAVEDLLKTRDTVCISPCSKVNLEVLQTTAIEPVVAEPKVATKVATSNTSTGA